MNKDNILDIEQLKLKINAKLNLKPIVLVGMMGVGKSAIGKLLAKSLDKSFIDIDKDIEKIYNLKINEIFEKYGEHKFREIEFDEIKKIKNNSNTVIATGGGAFTFKHNYELINENSVSIWLKANEKIILDRVKMSINKRPLLKNKNINENINNLLKMRNPLYAKAHIHIESLNETKTIMNNKLLLAISNYLKKIKLWIKILK